MPLPTLLDIAKANGSDAVVGLIEETIKSHPELEIVPARTIRGTGYKTLVRTALGQTTGGFRSANAGVAPTKSTFENRYVETFILEARFTVDRAVADRHEDGAAAYLAMEAVGVMEGEMQGLGKQFFYGTGTGGNASGHPGLIQSYDTTNMEIDATGTTASTGSSCYLVKFGAQNVQWVWGNNGSLNLGAIAEQLVNDPNDATKQFTAYVQNLLAYPGIQVGSMNSVLRIKKLTADSGKGMTDALLAQAMYKFADRGAGRPDAIFMSHRSRYQLQTSRSVTLQGGQANVGGGISNVALPPTSYDGVPIYATNSISNTESLTL